MLILKAFISCCNYVINKFKKHIREKEKSLKDYYYPYYTEVENVLSRHLQTITWLNEEITSWCSSLSDDDMHQQMKDIEEHNNHIHAAAAKASQGASIYDMAIEIDTLVVKIKGIVDDSLIESLTQYSRELYDSNEIGEHHFLIEPCQNTLTLTRDIKSKIPTVHAKSDIQ